MVNRTYTHTLDADTLRFALSTDRQGKTQIIMTHGAENKEVALVSPPCVTQYPRCSGTGNFGTQFGPTDESKAKFLLDLTDEMINQQPNAQWQPFVAMLEAIDDKLLDYVYQNQVRVIGRKNLSKDELRMLQIRTVKPKYDKMTGALSGHTVNYSRSKYVWAGGGKVEKPVTVCDRDGNVVPHGIVCAGDVVAATIYANMVYSGVGGDKFGIHWSFEDVCVVCQRNKLDVRTHVPAFHNMSTTTFSADYTDFSDNFTYASEACAV
jgi:hypothetical protein